VTDFVDGGRVFEDEKIPALQLMSRYVYLVFGSKGSKQELMKSWCRGFMRWRRRGSHYEEARRDFSL
jgi:hypothetical protein